MPEELRALARPRSTHGESLFDLAQWRLPKYDGELKYGTEAWWTSAFEIPGGPRLLLALESEMGKWNNARGTIREVMDDASKLLGASALVKIMVFASTNIQNRNAIVGLLERLAKSDPLRLAGATQQAPTWAYVDLPWNHALTPVAGILGD